MKLDSSHWVAKDVTESEGNMHIAPGVRSGNSRWIGVFGLDFHYRESCFYIWFSHGR